MDRIYRKADEGRPGRNYKCIGLIFRMAVLRQTAFVDNLDNGPLFTIILTYLTDFSATLWCLTTHKVMLIFKLLDRYEGIGQRGFFGCAVKLSNAFKSTRINLQILIIGIPLKINFLQFIRY